MVISRALRLGLLLLSLVLGLVVDARKPALASSGASLAGTSLSFTEGLPPFVTRVDVSPAEPLIGHPVYFEIVTVEYTGPVPIFEWLCNGIPLPNEDRPNYRTLTALPGTYEVVIRSDQWGWCRLPVARVGQPGRPQRIPAIGGQVRVSPDLAEFRTETTVEVEAIPDPGFHFRRWRQGPTEETSVAHLVIGPQSILAIEAEFGSDGGSVFFANRSTGIGLDAPVTDADGVTLLAGSAYLAQLYAGPSYETLEPVGPPTPFLTGSGAGYFLAGDRYIPSVDPGGRAYVQIRAWQASAGSSYEEADAAVAPVGFSSVISVVTGNAGTPPTVPPLLRNLLPFSLVGTIAPQLVLAPRPLAVPLGRVARLDAWATARPSPTYQWFKDGQPIPGATHPTLEIAAVQLSDAAEYSVRVENSLGSETSAAVPLTIIEPPVLDSVSPSRTLLAGERAELAATATSRVPLLFQWFQGEPPDTSHPLPGLGPTNATPPLFVTTAFWVGVSNAAGIVRSPAVTITVERRGQKITFEPLPAATYGQPPVVLAATASSGLPLQFSVVSGPGTLAAGRLAVTGAGTVVVRASQPGDDYFLPALDVERTLLVAKAPATVTLADLEFDADGQPHRPTVTTEPPGLPVRLVFDGRAEAPSAPGEYHVTALAEDANHVGTAEATLVIRGRTHPLSVLVYLDRNGSGRRDVDEPGLSNTVVVLTSTANAPVLTATTGADGIATFSAAPEGPVRLHEVNPADVLDTTPNDLTVTVPLLLGDPIPAFGDQRAGVAVGTVFLDRDGNGRRDPGEPGREGIEITLTSESGTTRTEISGPGGGFALGPLAPGLYRIAATLPAGFGATSAHQRAFAVFGGQAATIDFGQQLIGTISGRVFLDLDGNGEAGPDEAGVPGATIRLTDVTGRRPPETTISDANGAFAFAGIPAGDYGVDEADPPGFTSSTPNAQAVHLGSGASAAVRFGDLLARTISGVVFEDWNGDDRRDAAEPGLDGITVRLAAAATGQIVAETTTGNGGTFLFSGLPAGEYEARPTIPEDFTASVTTAAAASLLAHASAPTRLPVTSDSGTNPDSRFARAVSLPDQGASTVPFALHRAGTISGWVFEDRDGDGRDSPGEPGIAGVGIHLREASSGALRGDLVTDDHGYFIVPGLDAATYQILVERVPGFLAARSSQRLALASGAAAIANFAFALGGSAGVRVFDDADGDGQADPSETSLTGIAVQLIHRDGTVSELVTAADGTVLFTELAAGTASIRVTVPDGFVATTSAPAGIAVGPGTSPRLRFGLRSQWIHAPEFTVQPADIAFQAGSDVVLSASVSGWGTITYQWFKDGRALPAADGDRLVLRFAKESVAGAYHLEARNALGTGTSRTALVTLASSDPYELWATARALPATARGRGDDADHDGLPNVFEFLVGADPFVADAADSAVRPCPVVVRGVTGTFGGFELPFSHDAATLPVQLVRSTDLLHWTLLTPIMTRLSQGPVSDRVRLYDPTPLDEAAPRFLRLRIAAPSP